MKLITEDKYGDGVYRKVNDDGKIFCESCLRKDGYISYYNGNNWCVYCAGAKGWIDKKQVKKDLEEEDSLSMLNQLTDKEMLTHLLDKLDVWWQDRDKWIYVDQGWGSIEFTINEDTGELEDMKIQPGETL